ncbi:MAG: hypothetical protein HY660_15800 [Armatimonadetes bacterium]|nr:hypothetical protein [Armatimonadota bacterium]
MRPKPMLVAVSMLVVLAGILLILPHRAAPAPADTTRMTFVRVFLYTNGNITLAWTDGAGWHDVQLPEGRAPYALFIAQQFAAGRAVRTQRQGTETMFQVDIGTPR